MNTFHGRRRGHPRSPTVDRLALVLAGYAGARRLPNDGWHRHRLPLPRFVSLRANEVNFRTGPGVRYPIEWVFMRAGLPVQVSPNSTPGAKSATPTAPRAGSTKAC